MIILLCVGVCIVYHNAKWVRHYDMLPSARNYRRCFSSETLLVSENLFRTFRESEDQDSHDIPEMTTRRNRQQRCFKLFAQPTHTTWPNPISGLKAMLWKILLLHQCQWHKLSTMNWRLICKTFFKELFHFCSGEHRRNEKSRSRLEWNREKRIGGLLQRICYPDHHLLDWTLARYFLK